MFPQRRITTDTPDGNYSQALNLFVRGEDGWVQMPSRGISLNDYMKQLIKAHNADIDTDGTQEEFDMTLFEHLFDGPETIEGLLAEHYTLSWALATVREGLKKYEDAGIPEIMLDVFAADGKIHTLQDVKDFIDAMPNAAPKPRRATWKPVDDDDPVMATRFQCSCCGCEIYNDWDYEPPDDMWNYCPSCGAKMDADA